MPQTVMRKEAVEDKKIKEEMYPQSIELLKKGQV